MKNQLRIPAGLMVLCMLLFLSGCISTNTVSFLARDEIVKDSGVIMLRLRVKDDTGELRYGGAPSFVFQKETRGEASDGDRIWLEVSDGDKRAVWKKEAGIYHFDQYYYFTGKPGRYFIKYLYLDLGEKPGPIGRTTTYSWINVPLYKALDLKKDGLVSIGTIDLELIKGTTRKNGYSLRHSYDYTWNIDDTPEQTGNILSHFQSRYPLSGKKYANPQVMGKPFFGFYSNFNQYVSSSEKDTRWHDLDTKSVVITRLGKRALLMNGMNPDPGRYSYVTMKEIISLPEAYTIHYQMRWFEGMKNSTYGFEIRQDNNNIYSFGVMATGRPLIGIKKDGQWMGNPAVKGVSSFMGSAGQPDDFKIDFKDGMFTYSINGEKISTFRDVLGNNKSRIGFFVSGTQKAEVDFVSITEK